ncbi:uncharacterized protein [Palaemon carinicauda]|uniref:uncharacterized protein n=1 Tax=Palaemon carinicauda TaxID=392227 RepID=UPI0035B5EA64
MTRGVQNEWFDDAGVNELSICDIKEVREGQKKEELMERVRAVIKWESTSYPSFLNVPLESISSGAATQLPPVRHIRRAIRRYKQAAGAPHPIPSNLADMVIPSEYKKTSSGEDFLLYDSGLIEQRILLFSTPTNISLLEKSDNWFGNGTFKIVPELFYQLYTIHCLTSERVIPCVYALLPNKRQAAYEDILQNLLTINPRLNPKTFLINYEQAARSAIEEIFPNVTVNGCFYHLSQSI